MPEKPKPEIPTAYRATGNLIPVRLRKTTPDYCKTELRLGEYTSKEHGGNVFTSFKLYCKQPDWEHPEFTVKMQLANNSSGKSSTYASLPLPEFHQLISTMIQWCYDHRDQHKEFQDLSSELLRRRKIEEEYKSILQDVTNPTDFLEDGYISEATKNAQNKKTLENSKLFLHYFKNYFETDNPIHKRQCLDMMLSLFPNNTAEILNLIGNYQYDTQNMEQIEHAIDWLDSGRGFDPDDLLNSFNNIIKNT